MAKPAVYNPGMFVGIPNYDGSISAGTATSTWSISKNHSVSVGMFTGSLLAQAFNHLWVSALNSRQNGIRYFIMLHADVQVQTRYWGDVLVKEMQRTGADVLSVVIPMKTDAGLTSTAIGPTTQRFEIERRLTMREVFELPETFSLEDTDYDAENRSLLVNTGCMIVDLKGAWVEQICFHVDDRIVRDGDGGNFMYQTAPEDWNFSREAKILGAKVCATRKLSVIHHGQGHWVNSVPWGKLDTDTAELIKPPRVG